MPKRGIRFIMGVLLLAALSSSLVFSTVFAEGEGESTPVAAPSENWFARRPSECVSREKGDAQNKEYYTPVNCLYLLEPLGGRPGYDLFTILCPPNAKGCQYTLWHGEAIVSTMEGPVQAIITHNPDDSSTRGFTLFYGYLGLIYRYMSGIIVGVVILFIIVGGIQMITAMGDTAKFDEGKNRITKAITGMIIWFLASLILYTINPTFFVF